MFSKVLLFIILNLCALIVYSGDFYKCINENGQTVFSDKKCAENAEKFNIKEDKDYGDTSYGFGGGTYNSSDSGSKTIHTGPRGGRYYYNSSGNKTYVRTK